MHPTEFDISTIARRGTWDSDRSGRKIIESANICALISRDEAIYIVQDLIFRRFYTRNEMRRDEDCAQFRPLSRHTDTHAHTHTYMYTGSRGVNRLWCRRWTDITRVHIYMYRDTDIRYLSAARTCYSRVRAVSLSAPISISLYYLDNN